MTNRPDARLRAGLLGLLLLSLMPSVLMAQGVRFGPEFDASVEEVLTHWGAPGVVVSVVHDGVVVLEKGYGIAQVGASTAPDHETLAPVQSVTKPFTSLAVGILVDEGILAWDEPVRSYLPEFDAGDPLVSEQTTLRDLLSHRSGIPNVLPGGFYRDDFGSSDLVTQLADHPPEQTFREYVHYSQAGLGVIGEVILRATGMTWSDVIQSRLLSPLGMDSSFPDGRRMASALGDPDTIENLLVPARRREGEVVRDRFRMVAPAYCPAACLVTTASDMARFMSFVLDGGSYNGQQVISAEALQQTTAPHTVRLSGFVTSYADIMNPVSSFVTWGMGWGMYDALDRMVVEHPGSGRGSSVVAFVPEDGLGVFVSTNATWSMDSDAMVSALKFMAIETALGLPASDWAAILGPDHE